MDKIEAELSQQRDNFVKHTNHYNGKIARGDVLWEMQLQLNKSNEARLRKVEQTQYYASGISACIAFLLSWGIQLLV